ncbi:hypothetical protein B0F90DRAFT_1814656 [Multifurca ochricompacta]|uniref:Uncharacterized protein n=1 Tax=Multifurca ochricompacta TaxID=376703 RepID=A0AAD4M8J8_9AGAM|nr:hypothetical protein B0F90DRAFT_1814656 [Multifurca ochricompacta]
MYWHRRYGMVYGPSRFLWFAFGSIATLAWMRHQENNDVLGCHGRRRVEWERPGYSHGKQQQQQQQQQQDQQQDQNQNQNDSDPDSDWTRRHRHFHHHHHHHRRHGGDDTSVRDSRFEVQHPVPPPSPSPSPSPSPPSPSPPPLHGERYERPVEALPTQSQFSNEHDFERIRQLGHSAEEAISGMSEATIDSIMSALQRLKYRLAERRGQEQFQESQQSMVTALPATPPEEPSHPRHWV